MTSESLGAALAKRLAVAALVVVLIVAAAFAIPAATNTPTDREPLDTPEYDPAEVATTPVPAEGEIEADGSLGNRNGVVVIDDAHSNRFDRADLEPLVRELTSLGYGVRFHDGDQTLDQVLSNSNAYLVIDPGEEYESNEVASVRSYTREGGHLLLVGEPNRTRVSASLFGTSVSNQESALTSLAGETSRIRAGAFMPVSAHMPVLATKLGQTTPAVTGVSASSMRRDAVKPFRPCLVAA